MNRSEIGRSACGVAIFAALLTASALPARANNQFGGQDRANAASQMIVLGVQQGISSLPPTSGQAFTYNYNAELGTFMASEELGPTVLRSTQTIGAHRFSLRFATSYFELGETFDPITYQINPAADPAVPSPLFAQFGMSASANVTLLNFAATYGITDRIEATINVPVSVVQAKAFQLYTNPTGQPGQLGVIFVGANPTPQQIQNGFNAAFATNQLQIAQTSFSALQFDFNNGTHAGVGRISVGAKALVYEDDTFAAAFAPEFFVNSPNQNEFAGSNSPALLPRVIGQMKAAKRLRLHMDLGYDYDFSTAELRRFVWNTGFSVPMVGWTFDIGMGGSKFDKSIKWTPITTSGTGPMTPTHPDGIPATLTALDPSATELGTNFVDFLAGFKVKLLQNTVLSGSVNVPVTSDGFRPAAVGTVALEYYF